MELVERRRTIEEATRESTRYWASSFNLERTMADHTDNASLDLDEVIAFVELITRDRQALNALGGNWDAR